MNHNEGHVKPNAPREILQGSPLSIGHKSDTALYEWQTENYELSAKERWLTEAIPIKRHHSCFLVKEVSIVYEKKSRQTSTLLPTELKEGPSRPLRFKERSSPLTHVDKVSKATRESSQMQMISSFNHWPSSKMARLQTWTTAAIFFYRKIWWL